MTALSDRAGHDLVLPDEKHAVLEQSPPPPGTQPLFGLTPIARPTPDYCLPFRYVVVLATNSRRASHLPPSSGLLLEQFPLPRPRYQNVPLPVGKFARSCKKNVYAARTAVSTAAVIKSRYVVARTWDKYSVRYCGAKLNIIRFGLCCPSTVVCCVANEPTN